MNSSDLLLVQGGELARRTLPAPGPPPPGLLASIRHYLDYPGAIPPRTGHQSSRLSSHGGAKRRRKGGSMQRIGGCHLSIPEHLNQKADGLRLPDTKATEPTGHPEPSNKSHRSAEIRCQNLTTMRVAAARLGSEGP